MKDTGGFNDGMNNNIPTKRLLLIVTFVSFDGESCTVISLHDSILKAATEANRRLVSNRMWATNRRRNEQH